MAAGGILLMVLVDLYTYQAIRTLSHAYHRLVKNTTRGLFWLFTLLAVVAVAWVVIIDISNEKLRQWVVIVLAIFYFSKILLIVFILADDVRRAIRMAQRYFKRRKLKPGETLDEGHITRSEFLTRTALVAGGIPLAGLSFGILSGAHDFRLRKQTIYLPNLPKAFDGLRMGQISDIHTGSLFNKTAIQGGVELLMREKPDVIFFTGDLVNIETKEVNDYIGVFDKLKADLGVISVTGNHDYGNYRTWPTPEAKRKNQQDMIAAHKQMGYDLLINEHRFLEMGGDKIAILGVENWGVGPPLRFPKYGKLDLAHAGTEEAPLKILLSHDPTHWDAQIRPDYGDIDLTLSGHTHGYQLGVSVGSFTWSPAQYRFKQWAGLYQEGKQYLYVNRGFGCVGYPGRIGMPPELTLIELKRG
ncbi:metallophosphoesterase [Chryseolinea sp. Jin1]|uniref:Metallophosphoesterase n=2 Tax=Chryseolinea lacunae TaxID=2801331 RepID=A0ABS1KSS6_9BACT|nr:metallophosphoesterase [Chryseolinea lacunae]